MEFILSRRKFKPSYILLPVLNEQLLKHTWIVSQIILFLRLLVISLLITVNLLCNDLLN